MVGTEKKNSTKFQIINYIINHKATSKVELSRNPESQYANGLVQCK